MPRLDVTRSSEVKRTPRMIQLSTMFDLPQTGRSEAKWGLDVPIEDRDWQIGLIVGPSGSGKSTVARELFGDRLLQGFDWPGDQSVVDSFPKGMKIKEVSSILGSVGFNSPPSWLKPFGVLSNGEQFRVTMARALAEADGLVVVDEFTSVIDRQVAKIASSSVAKAIRRTPGRQFVAVSCHYDIIDWLQPDWMLEPQTGRFTWRRLQRRPGLEFAVHPVPVSAWQMFKPHHYLTGAIHKGAKCFGLMIEDQCVGFTSYIHFPHPKAQDIKHLHRTVVLPDWQGLGLGGMLADWAGEFLSGLGYRCRRIIAHPAVIAHCHRSPRWRFVGVSNNKQGGMTSTSKSLAKRFNLHALRRIHSFEYVPRGKPA